jgi:outer membrane protein
LKNIFLKAGIFIALFILSGFAKDSYAQMKFGYVDSEVILKQLPEAIQLTTDLEAFRDKFLDTLRTKAISYKEQDSLFAIAYTDAQQKVESGTVKSNEELKALNDQISNMRMQLAQMEEELKNYDQYVQQEVYNRRTELSKPLYDKINKTIETLAKEMGLTFVLDKASGGLLYGDKNSDITFKVLDKLK